MDECKENSSGKTILRNVFKIVSFFLIILLLLLQVTEVFRNKTGDAHLLLSKVLEKETDWDVIFLGNSSMDSAVYPMQLWSDYGFTSFNDAQSGESAANTYYVCKSMIRRCHPKVIVFNVTYLYLNRTYSNISWLHQSLDPLPLQERIPAILDIVPEEERWNFLFPMAVYHSRWKELRESDFVRKDNFFRGSTPSFTYDDAFKALEITEIPTGELKPEDIPLEYIDKIVDLCKETGTEVVLTFFPKFCFPDILKVSKKDNTKDPLYAKWLENHAKEKGFDFVNFYDLIDEIGFDFYEDLRDGGHPSYWGGEKLTNYLGRYLAEKYDLPDRRADPAYEKWNEDARQYDAWVKESILESRLERLGVSVKLSDLPVLPEKAMITREEYGDWVGNQGIVLEKCNDADADSGADLTIQSDAETVELYGWAADFTNNAPMQALYLQVGDYVLQCDYGSEWPSLAERFGFEDVRCGFTVSFPTALLKEKNLSEVAFVGVSADGTYRYNPVVYTITEADP